MAAASMEVEALALQQALGVALQAGCRIPPAQQRSAQ
jgi:hypothetical protein